MKGVATHLLCCFALLPLLVTASGALLEKEPAKDTGILTNINSSLADSIVPRNVLISSPFLRKSKKDVEETPLGLNKQATPSTFLSLLSESSQDRAGTGLASSGETDDIASIQHRHADNASSRRRKRPARVNPWHQIIRAKKRQEDGRVPPIVPQHLHQSIKQTTFGTELAAQSLESSEEKTVRTGTQITTFQFSLPTLPFLPGLPNLGNLFPKDPTTGGGPKVDNTGILPRLPTGQSIPNPPPEEARLMKLNPPEFRHVRRVPSRTAKQQMASGKSERK